MSCVELGTEKDYVDQEFSNNHKDSCRNDFNVDITTGHAGERHGPTASEANMQAHAVKGLEFNTKRNKSGSSKKAISDLVGNCTRFASSDQMAACREFFLSYHQSAMEARVANMPTSPTTNDCKFEANCPLDSAIDVYAVSARWNANDKLSISSVEMVAASKVYGSYNWDAAAGCWREVTLFAQL